MNAADQQPFIETITALAATLRESLSEDAITGYFQALEDLPFKHVQAAAHTLSTTATWFPRPVEWRKVCTDESIKALRSQIGNTSRDPWAFYCDGCEDTGWVPFRCPDIACDRSKKEPHSAHYYVRECGCRSLNPAWQRKIADVKEAAERRDKKRHAD